MTTPLFLLRKSVDWSLLRQGFSVPTEYLSLWQNLPGGRLERGERRQVRFYLDGVMYDDATLINQKFDESKYEGHADVFQIRYNEGSALVKKLRQIFASSFKYIEAERIARGGKSKSPIRVPEELQEFVVFSASIHPDVFVLECITKADNEALKSEIKEVSEYDFENGGSLSQFTQIHDENTGFVTAKTLQKVRKLDRSIGDSLKRLYDYRCQMTGEAVGIEHGVHVVEAHHIIPFTESMNNDTSNIIILSPSYHRIIHQAKPHFNYRLLAYEFPNGLVEKVKIDKHLRCIR